MCGIFGIIAKEEKYNRKELVELLEDVAKLSQVRGKGWEVSVQKSEIKRQKSEDGDRKSAWKI